MKKKRARELAARRRRLTERRRRIVRERNKVRTEARKTRRSHRLNRGQKAPSPDLVADMIEGAIVGAALGAFRAFLGHYPDWPVVAVELPLKPEGIE